MPVPLLIADLDHACWQLRYTSDTERRLSIGQRASSLFSLPGSQLLPVAECRALVTVVTTLDRVLARVARRWQLIASNVHGWMFSAHRRRV